MEHFQKYSNFEVKTVLYILEMFSIPSDSLMPDISLVCWKYKHFGSRNQASTLSSNKEIQHKLTPQGRKFHCNPNKPLSKVDSDGRGSRLVENYKAFYSDIETEYHQSAKTHHCSSRKPWWNPVLDSAGKNSD